MNFETISAKPLELLSLTGYTLAEFESLLPYFETELSVSKYTLEGKARERPSTEYKNSVFSTSSEKLFFILVYYKQYTTQAMIAQAFSISQPKANLWIHFLTPIMQNTLNQAGVAPARNMDDFSEKEPSVFSHDGTERPIQRPKDNEEQEKYYSGKQKRHTVKNNILANEDCEIVFLTPTVEGKKHDKTLADESNYSLPEGSTLLQDTGFQGFSVEGTTILQPKKSLEAGN